jgi:hypothetical protein
MMIHSTWNNLLGKLGRVMIRMGNHLLHLSRPKTALQQQGFTAKVSKKDLEKVQYLMKDPWLGNCD